MPSSHPLHSEQTVSFAAFDIADEVSLAKQCQRHDVLVHCAGPFQSSANPTAVLRVAASHGIPYIDISDDTAHSEACKALHINSPAIISTGVYPGLSNLLVHAAVSCVKNPRSIAIYYFTAGSGGIGSTVLATTFLLLSQKALAYLPEQTYHDAGSGVHTFDFGGTIGFRNVYFLNLPEVSSLHTHLAPNSSITAKFCTAPPVWNALLRLMTRFPDKLLTNRKAMKLLANISMPVVRIVDRIVGSTTGISVVVNDMLVRYEHDSLATAVGEATAAFVRILDKVPSGVWYPEELDDGVVKEIIENSVKTASIYESFKKGQPIQVR